MNIMLKVIRMELYQQMPNYRKPASFLIKESFPLPPYSSVIGMIHVLCGFEKYHPLKISIQGCYASELSDFSTSYTFGDKYSKKENRHNLKVENFSGTYDGITRGVKNTHLLTDMKLVIHVYPEEEKDFDLILNGLKNPLIYPALGRHEDIVRIDNIEAVEIEECTEDDATVLSNDMYIPIEDIDEELVGTVYNINKIFGIDKKTGLRNWIEVIKVQYVPKDEMVSLKKGYYDKGIKSLVCLA